jgi:hypothetical protein
MKLFYKIAGIIFIIGSVFFLRYNFDEIDTYKNGIIIDAKVVYVPNCFTTKQHYNIKFIFNDIRGHLKPTDF